VDSRGGRAFCADVSRADDEPLQATASCVDRWLLVEYRGLWAHDAVRQSTLTDAVKRALRRWRDSVPRSRVLFVRRTERRGRDGLLAFRADSYEGATWTRRFALERYEDLADVDLDTEGDRVEHPLLLVCTHGKHDPCCARLGRPLYEALREQADEEWVWQSSHVGGDRFAGNVVALPHGLYFGRVDPAHAWGLLDDVLAGRIPLHHYRGRSCHAFPVQAAERAVRELTGLVGVDDVRVARVRGTPGGWSVRLATPAGGWDVPVERRSGALTYLTCSAAELSHPRHYAAAGPPVRVV
jgi:hypothetical protein